MDVLPTPPTCAPACCVGQETSQAGNWGRGSVAPPRRAGRRAPPASRPAPAMSSPRWPGRPQSVAGTLLRSWALAGGWGTWLGHGLLTVPRSRPKVSCLKRGDLRSMSGARSGDRAPTGGPSQVACEEVEGQVVALPRDGGVVASALVAHEGVLA